MRLINLARHRLAVHFATACLFYALVYLWISNHSSPSFQNHQRSKICRVVSVQRSAASCPRSIVASLENDPCFWSIKVVGASMPRSRSLVVPENQYLNPKEVSRLQRLAGCNSAAECENERVNCTYGIEDPSDALWLREYQSSPKFVVIFKVGVASLIFFITAIICDGSIFEPRRSGLANPSASFIFLIAISFLLYILIVPRDRQLSLYGAGSLQSMSFVLLITAIATLLPAVVITGINITVFFVFFLGFLLEQLIYIFIGITHFLGVLSLYQTENALLHLRIIYTHDVLEQVDFDRRLVNMSRRFLSRIRQNWYLQRLPRAMEEDAMQIVSNVLPERLYNEVIHESIPQVSFETIDREEAGEEIQSQRGENADERTPLLQEMDEQQRYSI